MRTPVAEYLIRQRMAALERFLPAAKDGDVRSLHQARVATRRLRAAVPLCGTGRKADKVARAVRRLTRVLGPARELDVALQLLDELEQNDDIPRAAIERLRASIGEERRRLQEQLREQIEDFDLQKMLKRAVTLVRKDCEDRAAGDSAAAVETRVRTARRAQRLEAAIDNAAGLYLPDRLHAVRIAMKKLRYTLELAPSSRDGQPRNAAALRFLKRLQDLLGRMHDLEVLIARTRSIQSSPGASTLKMSADLDRLVRILETECRELHGHYVASRAKLITLCERLVRAGERGDRARTSAA